MNEKSKKRNLRLKVCEFLALAVAAGCLLTAITSAATVSPDGLETVTPDENARYNGIVIPAGWKFRVDNTYGYKTTPPYLLPADQGGYAPEIVNVDVGRQLFVDNFLIDSTTLSTTYHQAKTMEQPILVGDQEWESTTAYLASGGVWYDMEEKLYKMWYTAGFAGIMAYATSEDGIHWVRPETASNGSNLILRSMKGVAGSSVWLDYNAPADERYKMLIRLTERQTGYMGAANLYTSSNGILWKALTDADGNIATSGRMGDRSTFYYDEFNNEWVFSIRYITTAGYATSYVLNDSRTRARHSGSTFLEASQWDYWNEVADGDLPQFWLKTDASDPIDTTQGNEIPQLYNVDCIAYESVMVGLQQLWYGPKNEISEQKQIPKITEIQASYSRDGFYFDRPARGLGKGYALIPASRTSGTWDYGYLSTSTGGILVGDDEIRIYYSAISGLYDKGNGMIEKSAYCGGAIGYATLRRDGFASLDGSGELLTKPLTVTKPVKYLFVNAKTDGGSLRAEILDRDGGVLEGYSAEDCVPFSGDSCCTKLTWKNASDLSFLRGKGFRIRFIMENGELYSFWLSADPEGASGGAVAAGYTGSKDLHPDLSEGTETEAAPAPAKSGCKSSAASLLPLALLPFAVLPLRKRKKASPIRTTPDLSSNKSVSKTNSKRRHFK